jgi:hypothetical protein
MVLENSMSDSKIKNSLQITLNQVKTSVSSTIVENIHTATQRMRQEFENVCNSGNQVYHHEYFGIKFLKPYFMTLVKKS